MSFSSPAALVGFIKLNKTTFLCEPTTIKNPTDVAHSPDLVLILAWMNGQPRPMSKYTTRYQTLYPSAKILLITTTTPDVILRSNATMSKMHADALTVLLAMPKNSKILVHAFSNGGALTLTGLSRDYKKSAGGAIVMDLLVLDSAPGRNHWSRAVAAFEAGLSNNITARLIGGLLIRLVLFFYYIAHKLSSATDSIEVLRSELNKQELINIAAKRLYLYSDGDDMVSDKDVSDHIEDACNKGYHVRYEKFTGTKHVSHIIGSANDERYWTAIRETWNTAIS